MGDFGGQCELTSDAVLASGSCKYYAVNLYVDSNYIQMFIDYIQLSVCIKRRFVFSQSHHQ